MNYMTYIYITSIALALEFVALYVSALVACLLCVYMDGHVIPRSGQILVPVLRPTLPSQR